MGLVGSAVRRDDDLPADRGPDLAIWLAALGFGVALVVAVTAASLLGDGRPPEALRRAEAVSLDGLGRSQVLALGALTL